MSDYARIKALVVDDDPITRSVVREALERMGFTDVAEARDGIEAQTILTGRPDVDLVLTDIIMPRLDGLGLVKWGRMERPEVVWVILSALDRFEKAVEAIRAGAFDFLSKPVREEELEVSVRNAVEHQRLLRERAKLYATLEQKVYELENKTELLRRDLQRAEVIQRALLPHAPPPSYGMHVQGIYRPGHYVGGDLYDVQRLSESCVAFYVADATGHGVTAAMLAVLFKQRLRQLDANGEALVPAAVLQEANRTLVDALDTPGLFLTVVYGLLNLSTGELTLASAGHPPALFKSLSGDQQLLRRTGPALGLVEGARYDQHRFTLREGDRVLVYTDGLLTADSGEISHRLWRMMDSQMTDQATVFDILLEQISRTRSRVNEDEVDDVTALLLTKAAGESRFDNGSLPFPPRSTLHADLTPVVFCGEADDAWYLALRGRGTWKHSEVFYETACAILDDHRPLVLHLAECEYLDSTMLGTIHELVARGPVLLQGVQPAVHDLFAELQMLRVLEAVTPEREPPELLPIAHDAAQTDTKARILHAHEALAAISTSNQDRFKDVLNAIR